MADKQFSTYTSEQVQITEVGDGIIPIANADGLTTKGKINGSDLANDVQLQFNDYAKIYETTADKDADSTTYQEGDIIFDKETKKEYVIGSDGSASSAVEVVEFDNSINDLINQNTDNIGVNSDNIATNTDNISDNASNIATNTDNIATNTTAIALNTAKVSADGSIDTHSDVDTSTTAPTAGQGLIWNDTTEKWEPTDLSSGSGGAVSVRPNFVISSRASSTYSAINGIASKDDFAYMSVGSRYIMRHKVTPAGEYLIDNDSDSVYYWIDDSYKTVSATSINTTDEYIYTSSGASETSLIYRIDINTKTAVEMTLVGFPRPLTKNILLNSHNGKLYLQDGEDGYMYSASVSGTDINYISEFQIPEPVVVTNGLDNSTFKGFFINEDKNTLWYYPNYHTLIKADLNGNEISRFTAKVGLGLGTEKSSALWEKDNILYLTFGSYDSEDTNGTTTIVLEDFNN